MRRVVVTGIGAVTPFGVGVDILWRSLLSSANGITRISHLDLRGDLVSIAGVMPAVDWAGYAGKTLPLFSNLPHDESIRSFFLAVYEAVEQSGLDLLNRESTHRVGAFIAARDTGQSVHIDHYAGLLAKSKDQAGKFNERIFFQLLKDSKFEKAPFFAEASNLNRLVSYVYNITGPQLSVSTACASGNSALGEAFLKIGNEEIDVAIAGGAYNFDLNAMIGFTRLGALALNADPEVACCPFDAKRSGFVMGSGCGILILEDFESAKRRGAEILGEIKGYGYYSDAFRATDPDPEAVGIRRTITACLEMAGVNADEVDYINAHGTSTKMNDLAETTAIKKVFKQHAHAIPISSTKSMIGHSIMAAGGIEAIVCIKSMGDGLIHPTRNWRDRDPELDLDYVPDQPREKRLAYVLSNNFGFGGQNASILFARV